MTKDVVKKNITDYFTKKIAKSELKRCGLKEYVPKKKEICPYFDWIACPIHTKDDCKECNSLEMFDAGRKQTLEEVLKELKKTKKMIETYIKPLSEYERGRYEHAWNMILKLEQKIKDVSK
jgi:hypothetical protein